VTNSVSFQLPNDGYFRARPETVGTSEAEFTKTQMTEQRQKELAASMVAAMRELQDAIPMGRC